MSRQVTAARLVEFGKPLQVQEVPLAVPGPDEVLVELDFAGVNPVDRYTAAGLVAADGPLPRTLGGEASGHLDGRPVLVNGEGLGARRDGVYATAAIVPRAAVVDVPAGIDPHEAAAVGVAGLTAYSCVVTHAAVGKDDRVLIMGAGGGVGLPAVSLAVDRGAAVWGQVGSAAKADAVRDAGAAHVLITDAAGLADAAAKFKPTVVIDPLGGAFTPAAIGLLTEHGRYVVFGTSAGKEVTLDWQSVYRRSLTVFGYSGFGLQAGERRQRLARVLEELAAGRMHIPIERTVALARVQEAFDALADRAVTGKIMLQLR